MRDEKTLQGTFTGCSAEGSYTPLAEIDIDQASAMLTVALADLETVKEWEKKAPKESKQWNAIYKLAYDVIHTLCEAIIIFDRVKARTHECVFAYICHKHPELEINWSFLETARTIRNRSVYYGEPASYQHWKEAQLQMHLSIRELKRAIEQRLKERQQE